MLTTFKITPSMSTYILAFVISDFAVNEQVKNDITFRVLSRPDQMKNTQFAIDTASSALQLYENNFDVLFESDKLDQVALPLFNYGAMKNNYIIFYHEDFLLYDVNANSFQRKELVAATIAHEVRSN